uniref:Transcriptional regulator n=1 Tax=Steinernema glaseri TaxID=37863 RepID=A0A1I8ARJ9_9BILA
MPLNQIVAKLLTCLQDENVGECKVKRKLDNRREIVYTIPANV